MRFAYPAWIITLFFCLASFSVRAEVLLLTPPSQEALKIARQIRDKVTVDKVVIASSLPKDKEYDLVVTLGRDTLKHYGSAIKSPLISSFISLYDYQKNAGQLNTDHSAVFSQASPENMLDFIHKTFGSITLGYVYSDQDDAYLSELKALAADFDITLHDVPLQSRDIFKTLRRLFRKRSVDLMLVTNNPNLYDSRKIRYVLEALYRHKIPAVTFSKAFLGIGAVASVYAPEDLMVEKTAHEINHYLETQELNVASYGDSVYQLNDHMIQYYAAVSNQLKLKGYD